MKLMIDLKIKFELERMISILGVRNFHENNSWSVIQPMFFNTNSEYFVGNFYHNYIPPYTGLVGTTSSLTGKLHQWGTFRY